jgi:hypothetical protein
VLPMVKKKDKDTTAIRPSIHPSIQFSYIYS